MNPRRADSQRAMRRTASHAAKPGSARHVLAPVAVLERFAHSGVRLDIMTSAERG